MLVAGMISGTSADGIDVAIADITGRPGAPGEALSVRQRVFATIPWPAAERALIFDLFANRGTPQAVCRANFALGATFARAVAEVAQAAGIPLGDIDLIGSHGQTIWHDAEGECITSTLQIGEPAVIAGQTGITTVADFRVADVAAGGQGAPLVSIFDWLLLRPADGLNGVAGGWRAAQNIGGIGNVTFLPPLGSDAPPLAFDTGPGNVLIDWAAAFASDGALAYDHDGRLAAQGRVDEALVARWLDDPYLRQPPPKTTGRERYTATLAQALHGAARDAGLSDADFAATVTALTAASIADAYARFAPGPLAQVVVSGGGARNPVLMAAIGERVAAQLGRPIEVCTIETLGIDGDAKEALTFALLAYLCVHGLPGNVPACTGASEEVVLGVVAPGRNYRRLEIGDWRLG